jgi:hypothetical protein
MTITAYRAVRQPANSPTTAPNPIRSPAIKVICVQLNDIPNRRGAEEADLIRDATIRSLRDLYGQVRSGINIVWVTTMDEARQEVRAQDLVFYFVTNFDAGLLCPFIEQMAERGAANARASYARIVNRYSGDGDAHNVGLTLPNYEPRWMLSEIYMQRVYALNRDIRNMGNTNWHQSARTVGRELAGVAFHEGMHNKVEPDRADVIVGHPSPGEAATRPWDLHEQADGGGAIANVNGCREDPNSTNQRLMRERIANRRYRQQVPAHGRSVEVPPPAGQERQQPQPSQQQDDQLSNDLNNL